MVSVLGKRTVPGQGDQSCKGAEEARTILNKMGFCKEVTIEQRCKAVRSYPGRCVGEELFRQRRGQCGQYRLNKESKEGVILRGGRDQAWRFTPNKNRICWWVGVEVSRDVTQVLKAHSGHL